MAGLIDGAVWLDGGVGWGSPCGEKWRASFSDADEAVKMESLNEKAHVRRAKAARELKKYFQAIASFKSAIAINARNTEARTLLKEVETLHRLELLSKGGDDGTNDNKSERLRDRDGRLLRDDEALLRCSKIVDALRAAKDAAVGADPDAVVEVTRQLELLKPVSESLQRSGAVMEMLPNPIIQDYMRAVDGLKLLAELTEVGRS